jgi:hypothetical protein
MEKFIKQTSKSMHFAVRIYYRICLADGAFNLKRLQHPGRRLRSLAAVKECIYRYCDNPYILYENNIIEYGNEQ